MTKGISFDKQAQEDLLTGITPLFKAVSATFGPLGSNVAIDKSWGVQVIHDGVKVANEVTVDDPHARIGTQLVREAAAKTNSMSGDGTTTATILAYHIFKHFMNSHHPRRLRTKLLAEAKALSKALTDHATPVTDIGHIASISAQDDEIGAKIKEAFDKMGKNGVITVEEGTGTEISVSYKEGMEFDRGYASAYFSTNDKKEAEVKNPAILITDKKLSSLNDIAPAIDAILPTTKDIVIIAEEIKNDALATLVLNKVKGVFNLVAIPAPGFGDRQKALLEDMATLTGATIISEATGRTLASVTKEDFGHADAVWSDRDNSRIVGGKGDKGVLAKHIQQIEEAVKKATTDFDREFLRGRLAKLTNGVAVITIGAKTEMALTEKKEQAIDAVSACHSALEEGIVPGGATSLVYLCPDGLLKSIITKPFEVLMENSELDYTPDVLKKFGWGIDVMDGQYKDLMHAGIVDPVKVLREALENAVSVATGMLTTRVLIPQPEEKKPTHLG